MAAATPVQADSPMSILAFLSICAAGAVLGLVALPFRRWSRVVSLAGLTAAFVAAVLIGTTDTLTIGEVELRASWYVGLFLTAMTATCLLLFLLGAVAGWPDRLAPAALATFGGLGVALSATDPAVALTAVAAATAPGVLVAVRAWPTPVAEGIGLAELRTLGLVVASTLLAAAVAFHPNWASQDLTPVYALTFLALGIALAVRSGAVPFHVPAARLSTVGARPGLVLLLVWIPAGLGVLALSWTSATYGMKGDALNAAVAVIQVIAVATLILGAVGALLHDELDEIAAYSIVQDAAFILLALTTRDAGASQPARLWLLAFIVAKSALTAWVMAMVWRFGTSNLASLRGWLRRAPLLGIALLVIVLATLGWPGSPVSEARATLVRLALPSQLHFLGVTAILLSLAYYGRLLAVGLLAPSDEVTTAAGEGWQWPARPAPPIAADVVADAGTEKPRRKRAAKTTASAAVVSTPTLGTDPGAPNKATPGGAAAFGRQGWQAWRLNRRLEASLLVLGIAALAAAIAFGGLGASSATRTGVGLDAVVAPTSWVPNGDGEPLQPVETPPPTSVAPSGSVEASGSPEITPASPSPAPTASPSLVGDPVYSSKPSPSD
jgi:NADH:ubiquinone oxidoreductase subunit 2 (subunit N)